MGNNSRAAQLVREILNNLAPDKFAALMEKYANDPDWQEALNLFANWNPDAFSIAYGRWLTSQVQSGQMTGNDAYGQMSQFGGHFDDQSSKFLDNLIGQENVKQDQAFQTEMRDTSLISSGSQLSQLGLSPSSVIQVGGATSGVSSSPANQNMHSAASLKQQERINAFNQKMSLSRSLIGAAGQMASSGIYGAALGAMKHSAQSVAAAAAHSGIDALKAMRPELRDQLMKDQAARDERLGPYNLY